MITYCQQRGCEAFYKDHRWGAAKAHDEGWFLQKNGKAHCPQHIPLWVATWRKHMKEK